MERMDLNIAQTLSNFKLFSNPNKPILNIGSLSDENILKHKLILVYLVLVIIVLAYFKREELSKIFLNWIDLSKLNDRLSNLWISTHLTSAGELATTYVPTDFTSALGTVDEV